MNMWEKGRVLTVEECVIRQGLVHGTCPGLVEGNEYMFRIKAVNIGKYTTTVHTLYNVHMYTIYPELIEGNEYMFRIKAVNIGKYTTTVHTPYTMYTRFTHP